MLTNLRHIVSVLSLLLYIIFLRVFFDSFYKHLLPLSQYAFNLFKYSSVVTQKGHMRTPFVEENAGLVLHTEAVTKSIYLLDKVFTSNSS